MSGLGISALLLLLRLPRLPRRLWPRWPSLVVALAAAAELVPFLAWAVPPGSDAAFLALESRLLWGADGLPATDRPLGAVGFLVPAQFGVAALASDVSLLSGAAPERAVLLVSLAARGLTTVGLYALARRLLGDRTGAGVALAVAALSRIPLLFATGGDSVILAGALALAAFSLLVRGEGRSGAVAAGLFLAGALVADPWVAVLGAMAMTGLAVVGGPERRTRCLVALFVAGVGFLVFLVRWFALLTQGAVRDAFPLSLGDVGRWTAIGALVGGAALALCLRWRSSFALGLVLLAAVVPGIEGHRRQARVLLDHASVREWRRRADLLPPLAPVCTSSLGPAGIWIPAVTGHPSSPNWSPPWLGRIRGVSAPWCRPLVE